MPKLTYPIQRVFILALFSFSIFGEVKIDPTIRKLYGTKKEQLQAIEEISNNTELTPYLSRLLKEKNNVSLVVRKKILQLYAKNKSLDNDHIDWINDIRWVLNNDSKLFLDAIYVIGERKNRDFIYFLIENITSPNQETRQAVYNSINKIDDDRTIPYILELSKSKNPIYNYYYLEASTFFKDERVLKDVPQFIKNHNPGIRKKYLKYISLTDSNSKINQIINFTNDVDTDVKFNALQLLEKNYQSRFTPIILKLLHDPDDRIRELCVQLIYKLRNKQHARNISNQLSIETNQLLKKKMVETLVYLNDHGGGEGLIRVLSTENDKLILLQTISGIGTLNLKQSENSLRKILKTNDSLEIKKEIVHSMGKLKCESCVEDLLNIIKNQSNSLDLRIESIRSIGIINKPFSIGNLFNYLQLERNKRVKFELTKTIELMLGTLN